MCAAPSRTVCLTLALLALGCASAPQYFVLEPRVASETATYEPLVIPRRFFNASVADSGWFRARGRPTQLDGFPQRGRAQTAIPWGLSGDGRAMMLKGKGSRVRQAAIRGVPVRAHASDICFLHTFNPGADLREWFGESLRRQRQDEEPAEPPTLFRYRVHYADGGTLEVPVRWGEAIHDWLRPDWEPYVGLLKDMAWGRVAWTAPSPARPSEKLVLYAMEWPNPRPDKLITTIDVVSANGPEQNYGAPAILAITLQQKTATGETYYVAPSPTGDDANPGTFERPWGTLHKAAEALQPGDTVYVRGGRHRPDRVVEVQRSGTPEAWISFLGYPGETAVIDGRDVPLGGRNRRGILDVPDQSYIRIKNLHVYNSQGQGIGASGYAHHVEFLHNTVFFTCGTGLGAWRGPEVGSCHHIRAIGNRLLSTCSRAANRELLGRDRRGAEECLDAGGITDFEYAYNEVFYGDKEGIDCKGPCRRGKVHHNYVHHTGSIYIDAWNDRIEDIEVYSNVNHDSWGGFKLSTEGAAPADDVSFHHNLVYGCRAHGIYVTDYGEEKPNNIKTNIHIYNNTCHDNDQFGIFLEGQEVRDVIIRNNICTANDKFQIGAAGQDFDALNIQIDHNLIDEFYDRTDEARAIRGEELIVSDPLYVDPVAGDFHLQAGSPAIDAGHPAPRYNDPDGTRADVGALPRLQRLD